MLPLRPGLPERCTHDYKRNGSTTLFAALGVSTGKVTADACYPRHRHQEFLRFLKKVAAAHPGIELHVVLDNCRPFTWAKDADEPIAKIRPSKD
jgi:hypothetical protein